jgi:hypothetical protein
MSEPDVSDPTTFEVDVELEDKGFEQIPNALFLRDGDGPKISDGAVRCYLVLRHFGATQGFRIRQDKIATAMDRTDRAVRGYLAELENAGWLLRTPVFSQAGRREQRPSKIRVLWKQATPEQMQAHQKKVARMLAEHKAQTQARRDGIEPAPKPRRTRPHPSSQGRKESSGPARKESSGHGRKESSGHGRKESSGPDPASSQVSGGVSEGYPHSLTHTPDNQTPETHTRAQRGVHGPSPSVTHEHATNPDGSAVDGTRSARPDGPGRAAFERAAREQGIQLRSLGLPPGPEAS